MYKTGRDSTWKIGENKEQTWGGCAGFGSPSKHMVNDDLDESLHTHVRDLYPRKVPYQYTTSISITQSSRTIIKKHHVLRLLIARFIEKIA